MKDFLYAVLKVHMKNLLQFDRQGAIIIQVILDSSMVEHTAVNRGVVGSSPTRGVKNFATERLAKFFCISELFSWINVKGKIRNEHQGFECI